MIVSGSASIWYAVSHKMSDRLWVVIHRLILSEIFSSTWVDISPVT
jgi:hypothetical protein